MRSRQEIERELREARHALRQALTLNDQPSVRAMHEEIAELRRQLAILDIQEGREPVVAPPAGQPAGTDALPCNSGDPHDITMDLPMTIGGHPGSYPIRDRLINPDWRRALKAGFLYAIITFPILLVLLGYLLGSWWNKPSASAEPVKATQSVQVPVASNQPPAVANQVQNVHVDGTVTHRGTVNVRGAVVLVSPPPPPPAPAPVAQPDPCRGLTPDQCQALVIKP